MNNEFAFKTTLGVKYSYRISFSISESHSMEWSLCVTILSAEGVAAGVGSSDTE